MTKRFADALIDALEATGWSLQYLCEQAGVSYDQYKKLRQRALKSEHASTNVDDAVKIANAFGMTLDEFLQDETANLRSEAAVLWRSLDQGERDILLAASRGRRAGSDPAH